MHGYRDVVGRVEFQIETEYRLPRGNGAGDILARFLRLQNRVIAAENDDAPVWPRALNQVLRPTDRGAAKSARAHDEKCRKRPCESNLPKLRTATVLHFWLPQPTVVDKHS